jgi:hypothetical protein
MQSPKHYTQNPQAEEEFEMDYSGNLAANVYKIAREEKWNKDKIFDMLNNPPMFEKYILNVSEFWC